MPRLLCCMVVMPDDLVRYHESLLASLTSLRVVPDIHVRLYLQQGEGRGVSPVLRALLDSLVCRQDGNLSAARNEGISYALAEGFEHIYFHDASLICPAEMAVWLAHCERFPDANWRARAVFGDQPWAPPLARLLRSSLPLFPWLWTYLFRVDALADIRFREDIGPGSGSPRLSGEDVLFLQAYFSQPLAGGLRDMPVDIWHPARPADRSKHLTYAYGQGAMFRELLAAGGGVGVWTALLLFLANSLLGVLRQPGTGWRIWRLRYAGLIGGRAPYA